MKRVSLRFQTKRFLIVSHARCGGRMLASALATRHDVYCIKDPIKLQTIRSTTAAWNWLWQPFWLISRDAVGHVMLRNRGGLLRHVDKESKAFGMWNMIEQDPEIRIINLGRRHHLKRLASQRLAAKPGKQQVNITPQELADDIASYEAREAAVSKRLKHHQALEVKYEDLVAEPDLWFNNVQSFIGLKPERIRPKTEKVQTRNLSEAVKNYHQLLKHMRRWDGFGTVEFEAPEVSL